jgi:hypothetical protein
MIRSFTNSATMGCWDGSLSAGFSLFIFDSRRRFKITKAIAAAARIIPAPTPTPIPAAAPGLMSDDEDNDVEDVFVFETDVAVADGVEYVADPVVGRYMIVLRLDGPGAGKTSSVGSEQSGCPPL